MRYMIYKRAEDARREEFVLKKIFMQIINGFHVYKIRRSMFIRSSSLIINYRSIMFILPRRAINYFPTINYPQHSSAINYHYASRWQR